MVKHQDAKKTTLNVEKNGTSGSIMSNAPGATRDKSECVCERFDTIV